MTACWTAGCEEPATHLTWREPVVQAERVFARCWPHTVDYNNQMVARGLRMVTDVRRTTEARNEL